MADGGYTDFRYWLMEGWEWAKKQEAKCPLYWHKLEGQWHSYNLYGLHPLHLAEPVTHISYYEADAYARWAGKRLLTEAEWEVAAQRFAPEMPETAKFAHNSHLHPAAATAGELQLFGDCWEWTASAYLPYPKFKQAGGAIGEYNGKFMVNQMVLRGGSCATPEGHIRPTYRNFFHADKQFQFSGIRLAESL